MDAQKKFNTRLFLVILSVLVVCALGIGLGVYYNHLPENNPQRDQSSCEKAGGEWKLVEGTCLISSKVAGEVCTDGGQCQSGICFPPQLSEEQYARIQNSETLTNISGTCYADEFTEGCVAQVIKSTVSQTSLCYE